MTPMNERVVGAVDALRASPRRVIYKAVAPPYARLGLSAVLCAVLLFGIRVRGHLGSCVGFVLVEVP